MNENSSLGTVRISYTLNYSDYFYFARDYGLILYLALAMTYDIDKDYDLWLQEQADLLRSHHTESKIALANSCRVASVYRAIALPINSYKLSTSTRSD